MDTVVFLFVWFCVVPLAASRIAGDVVEEEIFAPLLALIDAIYRGTLIGKVVRCVLCFSHWVIFAFALGFFQSWARLPFPAWERPLVAVVCVFGAIEITNRIKRS